MEVHGFVIATPEDLPYDKLRIALIQRTSASEQRRLQQLLTSEEFSDRTPSKLPHFVACNNSLEMD